MKKFIGAISIVLSLSSAFAEQGVGAGGGGDTQTERRIIEIRDNIRTWIEVGNARELELPADVSYADYEATMKALLTPDAVVVTAIATAQEDPTDDESNTRVNGQPKTCKGFVSKKDRLMHILCNIERFNTMSEANQYRQVHHEYAGLGRLEKNVGARSDYRITDQITDKLRYEKVLRLPVTVTAIPSVPENERFCVARIVNNIDYASMTHYSVDCGKEKFETPNIITSVFFPLPYNWKSAAQKKLNAAMAERNMTLISKIKTKALVNEMLEKSLVIYGTKKDPNAVHCLVTRRNMSKAGVDMKNVIWDVDFEYDSPSFKTQTYSGLNQTEIETVLLKGGFKKTNITDLYKRP